MGCSCGTNGDDKKSMSKSNIVNLDRNNQDQQSRRNQNTNNNSNNNRSRSQPQQQQNQRNLPNYQPFLQSANDPTFNMKQLKETVGEGVKKMNGYVCNIEEEDLQRKRIDFWSSRFDNDLNTWEMLKNFCEGEFDSKELALLLNDCGIKPYAGCINVVYDNKGNLYEIPNYCIHPPSKWEIPKLEIPKPTEKKICFIVRLIVTDLTVNTSNLCPVSELKNYLLKKFPFPQEYGEITLERIRLFHLGKEIKNNDLLYQHHIEDEKIVIMMVKQLD